MILQIVNYHILAGTFSKNNVSIAPGKTVEYTVTCTLGTVNAGTIYENKASFTYDGKTITSSDFVKGEDEPPPEEEPDFGSPNIKKYITKVTHTNMGGETSYSRSGMDAASKDADPAEAEKDDIVRFRIEFYNDFHIGQSRNCNKSHYNRTWLDEVTFSDVMDKGLTYVGNVTSSHGGTVTSSSSNSFNFKWKTVDEGDTAWMEFDVKVDASNMTLMNLKNYVSNVNSKYVKYRCYYRWVGRRGHRRKKYYHPSSNLTKAFPGDDADYVRLLDPEIAGVVWLENGNPDGLKNGSEGISSMPQEQQKVNVELWNETTGKMVDKKIVNSDGSFTFYRVRKGPNYTGTKTNANGNDDVNIGTGNHFKYTSDKLYKYYIIYDYDGERYKATINSKMSNLDSSYKMNSNFPIDSNADELKRKEFNQSLETIAEDIAYDSSEPSNGKKLKYDKSGSNLSVSKLWWDGNLDLDTTFNVTMKAKSFTLFFPDGDTEYLKHINLGLVLREEADLSATKDVYKAEVTVNGYQTTYVYDQLGSGKYTVTSSNTVSTPYKLRIYREDYEFRTAKFGDLANAVSANNPYTSDGRDNDLQIILTYKITITNNSDTADAVVREILDFSSDELTPLHAYMNSIDGDELELDTSGRYNGSHRASGYDVRFIYGDALADETIPTGESIDVFTTYRVNKDANGYIIKDTVDSLGKINVAEIAAFSFYEKGGKTPIGLVDKNSNPANTEDPTKTDEYEDDTFRTSIQILLRDEDDDPDDDPDDEPWSDRDEKDYRNISGIVWEEKVDSSDEKTDGQRVGNGVLDGNDTPAKNVIVKLYEVVETNGLEYMVDTGLWYRTGNDGKYSFGNKMNGLDGSRKPVNPTNINESTDDCYRLHAGRYVVRFIYGDEPENLIGDSAGTTLRYSGQDFKSVRYTEVGGQDENEVIEASKFSTSSNVSDGKTHSVAKDNEARRLEVTAYSTTMTNTVDRILKATTNDEKILLARNTSMYADTKKFDMQLEYYENYSEDSGVGEYISKSTITKDDHVIDFTERVKTYYVRKVDFGLIERPITKLQLMNDITEIIAETSDGNEILHLFFDIIYEPKSDGTINHYAVKNEAKSTGLQKTQVLNRNGPNQGFRYINIDSEILQGMKITLKFRIAISNNSEIDHLANITDTLVKNSKIELKVGYDGASTTTMTRNGNIIVETLKDNGTTRTYNYTNSELYKKSQSREIKGDSSEKLGEIYTYDGGSKYNGNVIGTKDVSTSYSYNNLKKKDNTYFVGKYMGNIYYRGTGTSVYSSIPDKRVETRNDQYLDYVDNDLVFKTEDNLNDKGIIKYLTYSASEIAERGLMYGVDNNTQIITDGYKNYYEVGNNNTNNNLAFNIEDGIINGKIYKYLPAKSKTVQVLNESTLGIDINGDGDKDDIINSVGNPYGDVTTYENQLDNDLYFINLQASRTLTSEVDLDGINIDNLAEIVKVSNTVGRKVYVKTSETGYIGNTKPEVEKINKDPKSIVEVARAETDTDFTEFVTFSPPTGLSLSEMRHIETMDKITDYVIIAVSSVVIIVGSIYVVIQFIKRKKFYK